MNIQIFISTFRLKIFICVCSENSTITYHVSTWIQYCLHKRELAVYVLPSLEADLTITNNDDDEIHFVDIFRFG